MGGCYDGRKDLVCDRCSTCPIRRSGAVGSCRRPNIQMQSAYKVRIPTATAAATPINIFLNIKSLFDKRVPAAADYFQRQGHASPIWGMLGVEP